MSDNATKDYLEAFSYMAARFKVEANNMLDQYYAQLCEGKELGQHGRDRNTPRYPGEASTADYRIRVINAWEENIGRGGTDDIQRVIDGYGFIFKSHKSGFVGGDSYDSYNIVLRNTAGAQIYDGTFDYDGTKIYDGLPANGFHVEFKRQTGDPVPAEIKQSMYTDLLRIVRASITQIAFIDFEM